MWKLETLRSPARRRVTVKRRSQNKTPTPRTHLPPQNPKPAQKQKTKKCFWWLTKKVRLSELNIGTISSELKDLFRGFVEVGLCRLDNNNVVEKRSALTQFKRTVADFNAEFWDNQQKDAHEFLSCILENLTSVSNDLQALAASMGCNYTCPVSTHIAFKMLSTRTCKGCAHRSEREEDYLNLSLDFNDGLSVNRCLKEYLKKNELEYRCDCGGNKSMQQGSFLTLPNFLILQLQRFRFTPKYKLEKVNSRVELSMNLEVKSGLHSSMWSLRL